MKRVVVVLALALLGMMPQQAEATIIDFSYASSVLAGNIYKSPGGDYWTSDVPIAQLSITDAPAFNGDYAVADGILSFDTIKKTILVTGTVRLDDTHIVSGNLLTGTITGFERVYNSLVLWGPDQKSPDLLTAIGLAPDYQFGYGGYVTLSLRSSSPDGSIYQTGSLDIVNSSVPEPASMMLLGTGLVGLAGAARRRFAKK